MLSSWWGSAARKANASGPIHPYFHSRQGGDRQVWGRQTVFNSSSSCGYCDCETHPSATRSSEKEVTPFTPKFSGNNASLSQGQVSSILSTSRISEHAISMKISSAKLRLSQGGSGQGKTENVGEYGYQSVHATVKSRFRSPRIWSHKGLLHM